MKETATLTVEEHDGRLWLCAVRGDCSLKLAAFVDRESAEIYMECAAASLSVAFAQGQMGI